MGVARKWDDGGCTEKIEAQCALCRQKWENTSASPFLLFYHPDLQNENEDIVRKFNDGKCIVCGKEANSYPNHAPWRDVHIHCSCGFCIKGAGSHKSHYYQQERYRGCPIIFKRVPKQEKRKRNQSRQISQTARPPSNTPQPPPPTRVEKNLPQLSPLLPTTEPFWDRLVEPCPELEVDELDHSLITERNELIKDLQRRNIQLEVELDTAKKKELEAFELIKELTTKHTEGLQDLAQTKQRYKQKIIDQDFVCKATKLAGEIYEKLGDEYYSGQYFNAIHERFWCDDQNTRESRMEEELESILVDPLTHPDLNDYPPPCPFPPSLAESPHQEATPSPPSLAESFDTEATPSPPSLVESFHTETQSSPPSLVESFHTEATPSFPLSLFESFLTENQSPPSSLTELVHTEGSSFQRTEATPEPQHNKSQSYQNEEEQIQSYQVQSHPFHTYDWRHWAEEYRCSYSELYELTGQTEFSTKECRPEEFWHDDASERQCLIETERRRLERCIQQSTDREWRLFEKEASTLKFEIMQGLFDEGLSASQYLRQIRENCWDDDKISRQQNMKEEMQRLREYMQRLRPTSMTPPPPSPSYSLSSRSSSSPSRSPYSGCYTDEEDDPKIHNHLKRNRSSDFGSDTDDNTMISPEEEIESMEKATIQEGSVSGLLFEEREEDMAQAW